MIVRMINKVIAKINIATARLRKILEVEPI